MNTEQLVIAVQNGDKNAFKALYEEFYSGVYLTCIGIVKNENNAEDLTQDTFVTAFSKIGELNIPSAFKGWINRIAVNKCMNFLKRNSPVPVQDEELEAIYADEEEIYFPEELVLDSEKSRIISDIVKNCLTDVLYQTVIMFYFNEMSIKEIAQIMDCPEGTVSYRLNVARKRIKTAVSNYEKQTGDKLHAVVGVPFLFNLFRTEAESRIPTPFNESLFFQAESSPLNTTAKTVKKRGNFMKNIFVANKIASIVAIVAVVGVIGGVVIATNSGDKDNKSDDTRVTTSQSADSSKNSTSKNSTNTANNSSEAMTPEEEAYYTDLADKIKDKIDIMMTAVKEGDLETLSQCVEPNSEDAEFYNTMKDSQEFSEIVKTAFGDCTWLTNSVTPEKVKAEFDTAEKLDKENVEIYYKAGSRNMLFYMWYDQSLRKKGETVERSFFYETKEEGWTAYHKVIDAMPLACRDWSVSVTIPDSDGNFYMNFSISDFKDIGSIYNYYVDYKDDENFISYFVHDQCEINAYIVQPDNLPARYDESVNGIRWQVTDCLLDMDFEGARAILKKENGEDYSNLKDWDYENAPESERKFVDDYISNMKVNPAIVGCYSWDGNDPEYLTIYLVFEGDVLTNQFTDEDEIKWIEENNLKHLELISPTSGTYGTDYNAVARETLQYYSRIVDFAKSK